MSEDNKEVVIHNSIKINEGENNNKINEMNGLKLSTFHNDINNNDSKKIESSISNNNTSEYNNEINKKEEINLNTSRFPYCIVWTPIPLITYLIPSIGHTGIGTSNGIIHDFAGSFFISIDNFAFGKPTKYIKMELSELEKSNWDKAIEKGDNIFKMEEHKLFTNNCHSHVAYVLSQLNYKGKNNYNMVSIWWMLIIKGKYVSLCGFFKTYLGFIIIIFIIAIIIVIILIFKK